MGSLRHTRACSIPLHGHFATKTTMPAAAFLVSLLLISSTTVSSVLVNVQFNAASAGALLPADLSNAAKWNTTSSLTDSTIENMECAVRCVQVPIPYSVPAWPVVCCALCTGWSGD